MKTVIEMAREAGFYDGEIGRAEDAFERFAELVCEECHLVIAAGTDIKKPWVELTDEEVVDLKMLGRDLEFVSMTALRRFARDIQQSLKERNT